MGKVICKKHGGSSFDVTCSHVRAQIDEGEFPKAHRFNTVGRIFVCDQCLKFLDAESYRKLDQAGTPDWDDPRFEAYLEAWGAAHEALKDYRIVCSKCVDELEQKQRS